MFSHIDVKFCAAPDLTAGGGPIPVDELPDSFSLIMPDDTSIAWASESHNGNELFASSRVLQANQCARGFVTFESPKGQRPRLVEFTSSSTIDWQVP